MEIRQIPLSLVSPSPMNPRKTFDEDELQELADNIEKQGLLQPITVRPIADKTKFAVVDGNADFHPSMKSFAESAVSVLSANSTTDGVKGISLIPMVSLSTTSLKFPPLCERWTMTRHLKR